MQFLFVISSLQLFIRAITNFVWSQVDVDGDPRAVDIGWLWRGEGRGRANNVFFFHLNTSYVDPLIGDKLRIKHARNQWMANV